MPGRAITSPAEKPEVASAIDPADGKMPCARNIPCGPAPLGTIDTGLVSNITTVHPDPVRPVILPKIVEVEKSPGCVISIPAEKPEIASPIDPTDRVLPRTGDVR